MRTRNRNAWIWVALAALTLASVASAESGTKSPRDNAQPVLEFLAGGHTAQTALPHGIPRLTQSRNTGRIEALSQQGVAGAWMTMLPVLFVGVVSPLNQLSQGSVLCLGSVPAAPLLPPSFQRPPPLQIA